MQFDLLEDGRFVRLDDQGLLANDARLDHVQPDYRSAIPRIISAYTEVFAHSVHSVYIRGSVARGGAIPGFSDYDCVALLSVEPRDGARERVKALARALQAEFPFVSQFDLTFFLLADLLSNEEFNAWQFAIKVQSLCVFGTDVRPKLPDYRPDSGIAFSLFNLESRAAKFRARITSAFHPDATRYWCSWMMRTILRSGLELTLDREHAYSNELPLCLSTFSKYYPTRSGEMRHALQLAVNPSTDLEDIFEVAGALVEWLICERVNVYGR